MPKRSRSGEVSSPARVVAPTRVNGGRSSLSDPRGGTLSDHDVDLAVLHRRVEDLLDGRVQAMDLVDEEDVPRLQVGQQGREVAAALDHRPRGLAKARPHLVRDDVSEGGLAKAGGTEDEHVVEGVAARARRLDEETELLADGGLADVLVETTGADAPFDEFLASFRLGRHEAIVHPRPALGSAPLPVGRGPSGAAGESVMSGTLPRSPRDMGGGARRRGRRPWSPPAHQETTPLEGRANDRLAVEPGRVDRRDPALRLVRGEAERGESGDGLGERLFRHVHRPGPRAGKPVPQLEQEPLRRLLADARDPRETGRISGPHAAREPVGIEAGEEGEGHLAADPAHPEQPAERVPLDATGEPVEARNLVTHREVGVKHDRLTHRRQGVERGHRRFELVSHSAHVDQEPGRMALPQHPFQASDHGCGSGRSRASRSRLWAWQRATARASASSVRGASGRESSTRTMCCTWALDALPLPVVACLTRVAAYSKTGMWGTATRAAPRACPSLRADSALRATKTLSIASSLGAYRSETSRRPSTILRRRSAMSSPATRMQPLATCRFPAGTASITP